MFPVDDVGLLLLETLVRIGGALISERRLLYPRRERRKQQSTRHKLKRITIGMQVGYRPLCPLPMCRGFGKCRHRQWGYTDGLPMLLDTGTVIATRDSRYLIQGHYRGYFDTVWATRSELFVKDCTGRYWNVPLSGSV